jgi:hypothetical protein
MDKNSIREIDLEKRCADMFLSAGWAVKRETRVQFGDRSFVPDLTLDYQGESFGYVEIFSFQNEQNTRRKIDIAASYATSIKSPVFVVTNGVFFDVYYYGRYCGRRTCLPTPRIVMAALSHGEGGPR